MNPSAASGTAQQRKRGVVGGGRGAVGALVKITALFYLQLRLKKEIISKETVQFIYNFPHNSV